MTPYYQDDSVTIYHADCRELIDDLTFDVIVTDPPYGIGFEIPLSVPQTPNNDARTMTMGGHGPIIGDDQPFDPTHLLAASDRLVLFGANYYSDRLPVSGGWIVWDKSGGGIGPDNTFGDAELAWSSVASRPEIFRHLWKGLARGSESGSQKSLHPTQKPVRLMTWILQKWTTVDDVVIDPYMGSGPTLRAAKDLGRRAIGIELEERYCEIAARRMGQEVLDLGL